MESDYRKSDFRKTDYAINKYRKGIAYRNADCSILEVTFEKIAKDNPNVTPDDFEKLKKLSRAMHVERHDLYAAI